jgi:hypothetical protein
VEGKIKICMQQTTATVIGLMMSIGRDELRQTSVLRVKKRDFSFVGYGRLLMAMADVEKKGR